MLENEKKIDQKSFSPLLGYSAYDTLKKYLQSSKPTLRKTHSD